jgi:hypothetical protein
MNALCGPKFLRGITEPCDGSCCGLGKDGKPDPELTERVNRRADAWRRIVGADRILTRPGADCAKANLYILTRSPAERNFVTLNWVLC